MPFLLKDLIKDEVLEINGILQANGAPVKPVFDPTNSILKVLNVFMDWYNHLRQPMLTTDDLKELARKTDTLQRACKIVFPDKSGTSM
jgi:hypothetical protein